MHNDFVRRGVVSEPGCSRLVGTRMYNLRSQIMETVFCQNQLGPMWPVHSKQPEMKLVPEAWRILPSGQELLPVHVAQYQERVPRNGMEFGFVWL